MKVFFQHPGQVFCCSSVSLTPPYLTLPYLWGGQAVTPAQRWDCISSAQSLSPSGWFRSLGWGVSHTGSPSPLSSILHVHQVDPQVLHVVLTTSIHLFLCLPLLRCPHTSAAKILLTQSCSSRRCTCPNHVNLASRTLSVMHTTPRMRQISSFLFSSLNVRPRIHLSILILVLSKRSSSRLFNVHVSEP